MANNDDGLDPALIFPGPLALVAGPGSGKTTRLARRVKHLVQDEGADPDEITIITFTREAARNMKQRLTPPAKQDMVMSLAMLVCEMALRPASVIEQKSMRLVMP